MDATRRVLLAGSLATAAVPVRRARAQVPAPVELKLSHYNPPGSVHHKFLVLWGEKLAELSGGRLTLRIYPAAQLGPPPRQFDLARNGQADIALGLRGCPVTYERLQSFPGMRRIEAKWRDARAPSLRFSQSFASLRQRFSQPMARSTIQRFGRTTKPRAWSRRRTISVTRHGNAAFWPSWNTGPE